MHMADCRSQIYGVLQVDRFLLGALLQSQNEGLCCRRCATYMYVDCMQQSVIGPKVQYLYKTWGEITHSSKTARALASFLTFFVFLYDPSLARELQQHGSQNPLLDRLNRPDYTRVPLLPFSRRNIFKYNRWRSKSQCCGLFSFPLKPLPYNSI